MGREAVSIMFPMLPSEDVLLPPTAVTAAAPASATPVGTITLDSLRPRLSIFQLTRGSYRCYTHKLSLRVDGSFLLL